MIPNQTSRFQCRVNIGWAAAQQNSQLAWSLVSGASANKGVSTDQSALQLAIISLSSLSTVAFQRLFGREGRGVVVFYDIGAGLAEM